VTQTTTRARISTGIQSVIFPSVCLSLEQTVKGRVTGHNASYSRILKLGPVPQARSLEVINITNGNAQIAASPFSRSRWNVLAIAVFFFWRWPTAGGRNGLVPVRPGGKPGKSPNRKKAPPKRGATSRRNLGLIDAMRLLKCGLYKIEHFNDFFHFKLKVRSLAVGAMIAARAAALALRIASS
jgi:hypothetical protein